MIHLQQFDGCKNPSVSENLQTGLEFARNAKGHFSCLQTNEELTAALPVAI